LFVFVLRNPGYIPAGHRLLLSSSACKLLPLDLRVRRSSSLASVLKSLINYNKCKKEKEKDQYMLTV
jgi:hypothetical protein